MLLINTLVVSFCTNTNGPQLAKMMDIKIKHFTKLVIFAVILSVLWYFHSKATTFGTVFVESESRHDNANVAFSGKYNNVHLQAGAYRQEIPNKLKSRNLQWLQAHDQHEFQSSQGKQLHTGSEWNSSALVQVLDSNGSGADVRHQ